MATYTKRRTVYISDPRALAQNDLLYEYGKKNSHIMHKFHKVVVVHYFGKQLADMLQVKNVSDNGTRSHGRES